MRIDRRFRGPPDSGNGGYFAGLLARELSGSEVVVTLKRPAPLDVDLRVQSMGDKAVLFAGEDELAVAERVVSFAAPEGKPAMAGGSFPAQSARAVSLPVGGLQGNSPIRTER